jgi:hypothetical protein
MNGQYYRIDGICIDCPIGSFSFYYENINTKCYDAPKGSNNKLTIQNKLYIKSGYWRFHSYARTPLICPYGINACNGSYSYGNNICLYGYTGPMCGVCNNSNDESFYYNSYTNTCDICPVKRGSLDTRFVYLAIVLIIIIVIFLLTRLNVILLSRIIKTGSFSKEPIIISLNENDDIETGLFKNNNKNSINSKDNKDTKSSNNNKQIPTTSTSTKDTKTGKK